VNTKVKKAGLGAAIAAATFAPLLSFAQVTTSSVAARIDNETNTLFDYIDLAIEKFWPVLLGLALIVAVWFVGKAIYNYLHR